MRNIDSKCDIFYDMKTTKYDKLTNFTFENINFETKNSDYDKTINGELIK